MYGVVVVYEFGLWCVVFDCFEVVFFGDVVVVVFCVFV